jgi:hypothetical protein
MHRAFARKLQVARWSQLVGVVRSKDDGGMAVAAPGATLSARRAFSCLAEPEVGDTVLVARLDDGESAFVLAILERETDAPLALRSPRDTEVRVAGKLSLVADDATIAAPKFSLVSGAAELHATRLTAIVGSAEALFERVMQRARQVLRVVEELDHLRAGRIDYEAESVMSLHAENTTLTADGLVKMDGQQIQLG